MRYRGTVAMAVAVTMCSMAGTAFAQSRAADLGKREFEAKCAVCHGKDGSGLGPYAENLKHPLPDLRTMAKRNGGVFPVKATFEMIEGAGKGHGPRDMPVWGLDYTEKAAELYPDLPYNQTAYVRTRINALMEYLIQIQSK